MTSTTGAEVQLRLGATATIAGERRAGRDGEQGSGGFFVWETAEAALAAAVALHGQHFATPCALLCVFVGGRRLPVPHISLAEATQEGGKRCYPMITPISVNGRGLLAGL